MTTATETKPWTTSIEMWVPSGASVRGERRAWLWIRDGDGRTVVDTKDYDVYPLGDKHRAMIEAAPLMLDALIGLVNRYREEPGTYTPEGAAARAAIDAATK